MRVLVFVNLKEMIKLINECKLCNWLVINGVYVFFKDYIRFSLVGGIEGRMWFGG